MGSPYNVMRILYGNPAMFFCMGVREWPAGAVPEQKASSQHGYSRPVPRNLGMYTPPN